MLSSHETFGLPPSAHISLHKGGELAVWDRLNSVTGLREIAFKALRELPPHEIAMALQLHAHDLGGKKLRFKSLKKSVADRLLPLGRYRSGEESQWLLLKGAAPVLEPSEAELQAAAPGDVAEITQLINASHAKTPQGRSCEAWLGEDLFQSGVYAVLLKIKGETAGFGAAAQGEKRGEIKWLSLLPAWQGKGFESALLGALVRELAAHKQNIVAVNVEANAPALHPLYEAHGFRWDGDRYFHVYCA